MLSSSSQGTMDDLLETGKQHVEICSFPVSIGKHTFPDRRETIRFHLFIDQEYRKFVSFRSTAELIVTVPFYGNSTQHTIRQYTLPLLAFLTSVYMCPRVFLYLTWCLHQITLLFPCQRRRQMF